MGQLLLVPLAEVYGAAGAASGKDRPIRVGGAFGRTGVLRLIAISLPLATPECGNGRRRRSRQGLAVPNNPYTTSLRQLCERAAR